MTGLDKVIEIMLNQYSDYSIDKFTTDDAYDISQRVPGVRYYHGVSRICFVAADDPVRVLKVPYAEGWDNTHQIDYCAVEIANYAKAEELGIERILLKNTPAVTLASGLTLYWQPRYRTSHSDMNHKDRTKMEQKLEKAVNQHVVRMVVESCFEPWRLRNDWIARAVQVYGKKFMRRFEQWTKDNQVGDLHGRNCGYIGNGIPVLLDYGGYDD